ncbi:MAG: sigma-70 family RNA polymerase sigma factor [Pirellulales bacterium]
MDTQKHQLFAERLVREQHRVFRYVVSLVPNRADAEEIFQQTCLTLWENWERYDPSLDFFPWACGIAHNHWRNYYRKMENSQLLLDEAVMEQLHLRSVERQQQRPDIRRDALLACLQELPSGQREVVESYYGGSRTIQQIADVRSSTPNAIYKLLRRIRTALHNFISRRIEEESA